MDKYIHSRPATETELQAIADFLYWGLIDYYLDVLGYGDWVPKTCDWEIIGLDGFIESTSVTAWDMPEGTYLSCFASDEDVSHTDVAEGPHWFLLKSDGIVERCPQNLLPEGLSWDDTGSTKTEPTDDDLDTVKVCDFD